MSELTLTVLSLKYGDELVLKDKFTTYVHIITELLLCAHKYY